ncbi:MAG: transposase [Gammaproteobacteria bacterium]
MGRIKRKFTAEFKAWAVSRIAGQEQSVRALGREIGVSARVLLYWQDLYLREGPAGLARGSGRPRIGRGPRPLSPEEEIDSLRKKVGEQQLMLDFFREACKRVEASRPPSIGAGGTASSEPSGK